MFVNPWIWYIINDEMPDGIKMTGREITVFGLWFLLLIMWAFGIGYLGEYIIGYGHPNYMEYFTLAFVLSLALFICLSIYLIPKVMDRVCK